MPESGEERGDDWPGCTALRDLGWPGKAMEHNGTTKTELKFTAIRPCAYTACQKGGVIEGKSTNIAQILDEVIMHGVERKTMQLINCEFFPVSLMVTL